MNDNTASGPSRRDFLKVAGGAALATGMTAHSYGRILGANDRIRIAQLGCGSRSRGHVHMVQLASSRMPVETVAVCDIWSLAREKCAAHVEQVFKNKPRSYKYSEEMLASKDIDGVMISTGDFQHAKLCIDVVKAGKDCYVEKPFANILSEAKEARDVVKASKQVVQMGTEYRSEPYAIKVRDIIRSGRIGQLVRLEHQWCVNHQRWRFPPTDTGTSNIAHASPAEQMKWLNSRESQLREEDTDWNRWLLGKPYRPFDPHLYLEFRLYKDYSSGLFDQWMSHAVDLVHLWTDESYPVSVMASGGNLVWHDQRENPDTAAAVVMYPKGFMYTYQMTLGNSYRSFARIQGREGTIANYGVEASTFYTVSKEGGSRESDEEHLPEYTKLPIVPSPQEEEELLRIPGGPTPSNNSTDDDSLDHMMYWLNAMRDRKEPNATVDHGFSHSIVCIMAAQSYWTGKRLYWDPKREEIVDQPVTA